MTQRVQCRLAAILVCLAGPSLTSCESADPRQESVDPYDPSPHEAEFITVEPGVELEVLDWGGSGRSIILLAGLGNSAHVFDNFAPKLNDAFRVYGITRRGFGRSTQPESGYGTERLSQDVITVLDSLGLDRVFLVGHSIAGAEMSWIAAKYPLRVDRLVYLEAAYNYGGHTQLLGRLQYPGATPMTSADSASLEAVQRYRFATRGFRAPDAEIAAILRFDPDGRLVGSVTPGAITATVRDSALRPPYREIVAPALALYGDYSDITMEFPEFAAMDSAWQQQALAYSDSIAAIFDDPSKERFRTEIALGRSQVVEGTGHNLFLMREDEVLRLVRNFLQ